MLSQAQESRVRQIAKDENQWMRKEVKDLKRDTEAILSRLEKIDKRLEGSFLLIDK